MHPYEISGLRTPDSQGNFKFHAMVARMVKVNALRKYLGRPFLRASERIWPIVSRFAPFRPILIYGSFIHWLVKLQLPRKQYHGTYFVRNRPELQLLRGLANQKSQDSVLKILVLACSNGAEVYSILWTIRSARPDLRVVVHAVDISPDILAIAEKGVYSVRDSELVGSPIFERLADDEIESLFEREQDQFEVKSWIQENINWQVGDAGDPDLASRLGPQDIVVANKFLCHMAPTDAERCLRNIAHMVTPGGYLFVSGVDLDVRTKVARSLGWKPVPDLLEEMHNGDFSVTRDWPWHYWGLEPFNKNRRDWKFRYASVFQLGSEAFPT